MKKQIICILATLSLCAMTGKGAEVVEELSSARQNIKPSETTSMIAWGKPLLNGPIKTLILGSQRGLNEVLNFEKACDITPAVLAISDNIKKTINSQSPFGYDATHKLIAEKLKQNWDLLVLGKVPWTNISPKNRLLILQKVHKGMGLLYINPTSPDKYLKRVLKEKAITPPPSIIKHLKANSTLLKSKNHQIKYTRLGNGKICCVYHPNCEKTKSRILTPEIYEYDTPLDYQLYLEEISKLALWAAKRDSKVEISLSQDSNTIICALKQHNKKLSGDLTLNVWDSHGNIKNKQNTIISSANNKSSYGFNLPQLQNGHLLAQVTLKKGGKIITWGILRLSIQNNAKINNFTLNKYSYEANEPISGDISITGDPKEKMVQISVIDNLGRTIAIKKLPAAQTLNFNIKLSKTVVKLHSIHVKVINDKGTIAEARNEFVVRTPFNYKTMHLMSWVKSPSTFAQGLKQLRKYGVDTIYSYYLPNKTNKKIVAGIRNTTKANQWYIPMMWRTVSHNKGVRKPCLTDDTFTGVFTNKITRLTKLIAPYFPLAYSLGGENYLSNNEVCASPSCRTHFQTYLKTKYQTIEKLNTTWRTRHTSFKSIPSIFKKSMETCNTVSPWYDFRHNMDNVYIEFQNKGKAAIRTVDKKGIVGEESIGSTSTLGGLSFTTLYDNYRFAIYYINYMDAEMDRALKKPGTISGFYCGSYPADFNNKNYKYKWHLWNTLFYNMNSVVWWIGDSPILEGAALYPPALRPDLTPYSWFARMSADFKSMKHSGMAELLLNCNQQKSQIAIYYSRDSQFTSTFAGEKYALAAFIQLIKDLGLQGDVITEKKILSEKPILAPYKVLILADCELINSKVYEKLSQFARNGGLLVANTIPNKTLSNRYRSTFQLKNITLFNPKQFREYHKNSGMGPVKEFPFSADGKLVLDSFQKMIAMKKITAIASLKMNDGKNVSDCEVRIWNNGDETYLGIIRSPKHDLKELPVIVSLDKQYYVKSILDSSNNPPVLMKKISFTMTKGDVKLFSLTKKLPYNSYTVAINQNGKNVTLDFTTNSTKTTRIICVSVIDTAGKINKYYSSNVVLKNGKASYTIPFALNDQGEWEVRTRDTVSGKTNKNKDRHECTNGIINALNHS